jgi:2-polyprenyl-6-methoxyphenol hydroxylase-like FAD-dependent oxidoreductase
LRLRDGPQDRVTADFQDGTSDTGDLIIGCDGSHSKVREFLVGVEAAQLQPVQLTMINFPLSGYTADETRLLQTLHPVFKIAAHPERPGNAILAGVFSFLSRLPKNPLTRYVVSQELHI